MCQNYWFRLKNENTAIKENGYSCDFCCKNGRPGSHSPIKNKNVRAITHYILAAQKWNNVRRGSAPEHQNTLTMHDAVEKCPFLLKPLI